MAAEPPSDFMVEIGSHVAEREFSNVLRDLASDSLANSLELDKRHGLIWRLEKCLQKAQADEQWNLPHLSMVEDLSLNMFGSSVMGTCAPAGDLDISLEGWVNDSGNRVCLSDRSDERMEFKKGLLRDVLSVIKNAKFVCPLKSHQLILGANVPVFTFVDEETGVRCDVSVGNNAGVFKSHVMSLVLELDDRVRDLVVLVKKLFKANGVNDPKTGSFNSYCLTLLVAVFAQTRSPPLLPPLRRLFPRMRRDASRSRNRNELRCLIDTYGKRANDWAEEISKNGERNEETLAHLFMGFFGWVLYFMWQSQPTRSKDHYRATACVRTGGVERSYWSEKCSHHRLMVQDPFEQWMNCARTVKIGKLEAICNFLCSTTDKINAFQASRTPWNLEDLYGQIFGKQGPSAGVGVPNAAMPMVPTIYRTQSVDWQRRRGLIQRRWFSRGVEERTMERGRGIGLRVNVVEAHAIHFLPGPQSGQGSICGVIEDVEWPEDLREERKQLLEQHNLWLEDLREQYKRWLEAAWRALSALTVAVDNTQDD